MNDRIAIDPEICHGKPLVRGTRMRVAQTVGSLAGGRSFEDVQREYALTSKDLHAAITVTGSFFGRGGDSAIHPLGDMNYEHLITVEPGKRGDKPCIRGMRITVYDVLEYLASGMTEDEILTDFSEFTREDIQACSAFAADRKRKLRDAAEASVTACIGIDCGEVTVVHDDGGKGWT